MSHDETRSSRAPAGSEGVLPSATFAHLVAEERRRARREERDLSLCVFETREEGVAEGLEVLGRAYSASFLAGQVGWLGEGRLCILVPGPRPEGERVVRWITGKNEECAGPAIEARVWVYPHALQEGEAEDDGPQGKQRTGDTQGWSMPLCW